MMPYRRAWRIENGDGRGPFVGGGWRGIPYSEKYPGQMPPPDEDNCLRVDGRKDDLVRYPSGRHQPKKGFWGRLFAFPSLEVLLRWCGRGALESAQKNGFVISVYAVPFDQHVLYENQLVFDRDAAQLIRRIDPLDAFVEVEVCQLRKMAA